MTDINETDMSELDKPMTSDQLADDPSILNEGEPPKSGFAARRLKYKKAAASVVKDVPTVQEDAPSEMDADIPEIDLSGDIPPLASESDTVEVEATEPAASTTGPDEATAEEIQTTTDVEATPVKADSTVAQTVTYGFPDIDLKSIMADETPAEPVDIPKEPAARSAMPKIRRSAPTGSVRSDGRPLLKKKKPLISQSEPKETLKIDAGQKISAVAFNYVDEDIMNLGRKRKKRVNPNKKRSMKPEHKTLLKKFCGGVLYSIRSAAKPFKKIAGISALKAVGATTVTCLVLMNFMPDTSVNSANKVAELLTSPGRWTAEKMDDVTKEVRISVANSLANVASDILSASLDLAEVDPEERVKIAIKSISEGMDGDSVAALMGDEDLKTARPPMDRDQRIASTPKP